MTGSSQLLPSVEADDALPNPNPRPNADLGGQDSLVAAAHEAACNGLFDATLDDSSRAPLPHSSSLSGPRSFPLAVSAPAPPTTPASRRPDGPAEFQALTVALSASLPQTPTHLSLVGTALSASTVNESSSWSRQQASKDPIFSSSSRGGDAAHGATRNTLRVHTDFHAPAASSSITSANPVVPSTPRQRPEQQSLQALASPGISTTPTSSYIRPSSLALQHKGSSASLRPVSRTPSFTTIRNHGFGIGTASTASSTVPSPIISAMGDVTPLPSPLLSHDSPGPWKKLGRSPPIDNMLQPASGTYESVLVTANGESLSAALAHHARRKAYAELLGDTPRHRAEANSAQTHLQVTHMRDRSLSEYVPDLMQLPKRMITVSATHVKPPDGPDHAEPPYEIRLRREPHLSEARGLTSVEKPPTPPPSESSLPFGDGTASVELALAKTQKRYEYFEAFSRGDRKRRRWRSIKLLGQGTFSRVMLATSQMTETAEDLLDDVDDGSPAATPSTQTTSAPRLLYDRRSLVAVKVCEHGPKGGASEDRIEMSLKRELEIMQCIRHPSLVHLKAWNIEPTRAILVLSYCPGGDLFDVASQHRDLLSPRLLARMFAELVGAVRYLHDKHIVHRDIKLENVLVNLTPKELADLSTDWVTYPYSVTTLTDLGLSRYVADDEKLETRCGSDDYAAPEVIMGQPYDGRATDAWSLGVLLYALLEGRLPFDPNPGMSDAHRMRSRTSHRIARVEWRWIDFAGDDGEHEGDLSKFLAKGLNGAMEITEGLLRRARNRWTLGKVAETSWVSDALFADGGLRFRDEEEGEEVL